MCLKFQSKRPNPTSHWPRFCLMLGIVALPFLFAGCASKTAPAAKPSTFYLGADISELAQLENEGAIYMDGNKPGDAIAIFIKNGWTCFRLRIWVDPRDGVNNLEYTTRLAKRIKDAGGTFMLDFHYSDWWADPQKQNKPGAWAKLDFDALVNQTESYTANVIKTLKNAGATPDFVQIGNEITGGMLWPDAQVKVPHSDVKVYSGDVVVITPPEPYDDVKQWNHLIRVLKAASAGVRSVTTPADNVRIVVHIDCGGDWPVTKWYFDHLSEAQVDYDIIGQSYYPNWHGTIENLRDNFRETINHYHKDVMVVETAYPTRDVNPTPAARKNMIWPMTPEGQQQFLADVIKTVREAPEGHGIGVNYWRPEETYVRNPNGRSWGPDANSVFDDKGYPLPAMNVLNSQPSQPLAQAMR
jgi:arabinogalactan endo-1,4-beta-galactosidase